jgi:hypothetical protein
MALMTSLYGLDTLADVVEEIRSYADSVPTLPFVMGTVGRWGRFPGACCPMPQWRMTFGEPPVVFMGEGGHAGWSTPWR